MPSSIRRPQSLRRRRVGALIFGGVALFQLLLPRQVSNEGNIAGHAFAEGDMTPVIGAAAIVLVILAVAVVGLVNRRRPVCDLIIAKWRELDTIGDGNVDKAEFETNAGKIFGNRKITLAELTYLHGLIKRLDTNTEDGGKVTQEELSAGLHKVMSLIGGRPVETVDDLVEALEKLADAAHAAENEAVQAEVVKEMSQKSISKRSLSQKSLSQKSLSQKSISGASPKSPSQKSLSQKSVGGTDHDAVAATAGADEEGAP